MGAMKTEMGAMKTDNGEAGLIPLRCLERERCVLSQYLLFYRRAGI